MSQLGAVMGPKDMVDRMINQSRIHTDGWDSTYYNVKCVLVDSCWTFSQEAVLTSDNPAKKEKNESIFARTRTHEEVMNWVKIGRCIEISPLIFFNGYTRKRGMILFNWQNKCTNFDVITLLKQIKYFEYSIAVLSYPILEVPWIWSEFWLGDTDLEGR